MGRKASQNAMKDTSQPAKLMSTRWDIWAVDTDKPD